MIAIPYPRARYSIWLACLLLGSSLAHAQACALTVSQSTVDLGDILYPQLAPGHPPDAPHVLGTRQVTVQVHCPVASSINLILRGARQANGVQFAQRGEVDVQMHDALLDGRQVALQATDTLPAAANTGAARIQVMPGQRVVPMAGGQPAQGNHLTLQMSLTSTVPLDELATRDRKTLSGRVELEVNTL